MSQTELDQTIRRYYEKQCGRPDARGRSWDHCYGFFQKNREDLLDVEVQDTAALHLGCYLASWGMYRSPFLREHAYTVHKPVIRALASPPFSILWQRDVGARDNDDQLSGTIMDLVKEVETEYRERMGKQQQKDTDTLVTKVLLGTVGCLPARDTFFEKGFKEWFKAQESTYGGLNERFVKRILRVCISHRRKLAGLQPKILDLGGRPYPLMKLVDMHFWQIGLESP